MDAREMPPGLCFKWGVSASGSPPDCRSLVAGATGHISFFAVVVASEGGCHLVIREASSWDDAGTPQASEIHAVVHMKADGCSHVTFGEPDADGASDGYIHLCGVGNWKEHCKAMAAAFRLASSLIDGFYGDVWGMGPDGC